MRTRIASVMIGLMIVVAASSCKKTPDDGPSATTASGQAGAGQGGPAIKVAVVTGGHAFDVPNFYRMLRNLPGIDAYPQHIEHFASCPEETRDSYNAVLFYGMSRDVPEEEGPHYAGKPRAALQRIVEQGQGIAIMHHALLAWEDWDFWNQLIGFDNRNFRYKEGLQLKVVPTAEKHPVIEGLTTIAITDEGYVLHGEYDGEGQVLLTTEHEDAMKQVAWARQQDDCRIFCLTLGHDNEAWTNPAFLTILARGLKWSAE